MQKFQGENIPSRTFKYLQYITQEELLLNSTTTRAGIVPKLRKTCSTTPTKPVSVKQLTKQRSQNYPKPVKGQPITFASSSLNLDRNKTSQYQVNPPATKFDRNDNAQSIFSLKRQHNAQYNTQ